MSYNVYVMMQFHITSWNTSLHVPANQPASQAKTAKLVNGLSMAQQQQQLIQQRAISNGCLKGTSGKKECNNHHLVEWLTTRMTMMIVG